MYRFQSVNTGFFVVSNENDKPGQDIDTKPGGSIPKDSVRAQLSSPAFSSSSSNITLNHFFVQILHSNVPILNVPIAIAEITGATGLYVSLKVSLHHSFTITVGLLPTPGLGKCRQNQTYLVQREIFVDSPYDWIRYIHVSHSVD